MPYLTNRDIENQIPESFEQWLQWVYRIIALFLIFVALGLFNISVFFSYLVKIRLVIAGMVLFVIGIITLYFNRRRFPV